MFKKGMVLVAALSVCLTSVASHELRYCSKGKCVSTQKFHGQEAKRMCTEIKEVLNSNAAARDYYECSPVSESVPVETSTPDAIAGEGLYFRNPSWMYR